MSSRARRGACIAGVAALAVAVHSGSLANGFVYDDAQQVVRNPWIRDPALLPRLVVSGAWDYAGTASNYYRPAMHAFYTAVYAARGLDPAAFHLANLLLHATVCVLVFLLSELLLRDLLAALAAAAIFAVHPVHTEAVSWIGGVPDLAAALFCLGALLVHAGGEQRWRRLAAPALFLCALWSKEIALVLPVLLVVWDQALGRKLRVTRYLLYAAVATVYLALRAHALGGFAPVRRHEELGVFAVAINALPLVAAYARMLVLPTSLTVFHGFEPAISLDLRVILGAAIVLGAAGTAWWFRRSREVPVALAVLALPLLPVLYIPAVGENPLAERYLYLPSLGLVWLLILAVRAAVSRTTSLARLAAATGIGAVVALFSFASAARQSVWRSDRTLWEDAAAKSPGAPIPHYNFAVALKDEGELEGAIAEYEAALSIQQSSIAWTSLAAAQASLGRDQLARAALQNALALDPGYGPALNDLGLIELHAGRIESAIPLFERALELHPAMPEPRQNLALAYKALGMGKR